MRKGNQQTTIFFLFLIFIHSAFLDIIRGQPPLVGNLTPSIYLTVNEGNPFQLECPQTLSPVEYQWLKGRENIESSKVLQIPQASIENSGTYYCVAKNSFGASILQVFFVSVQYLHDFADSNDQTIDSHSDSPFILKRPQLIASNAIRPTFFWYRNDIEISSNLTHYVTGNGDLIVLDDHRADGSYRVTAYEENLGEAASGVYFVSINPSPKGQKINNFSIVYGPTDSNLILNEETKETIFDCVPSYSSGVNVNWFIDDQPINDDSSGVKLKQLNRQLVIKKNSDLIKNKLSLSIRCRCDALGGRVFDEKTAVLRIIANPQLNLLPSELIKTIGENLHVKCSLKDGFGPAEIRWWHNGKMLDTRDGIITLSSVNQQDFGIYQCEGTNQAGTTLSTIWIHEALTNEKRKERIESENLWGFEDSSLERSTNETIVPLTFTRKPVDKEARIGDEVTFDCSADGTPKPRMKWMFNGKVIRGESSKYEITRERLTISSIKTSDQGEYICIAETSKGSIEASARMNVIGISLIENGPTNQSILIGTNIEIPCETSKDLSEKVEVSWSLNDEPIGFSGNNGLRITQRKNRLLISQVGPDNIGEYKCTIRYNEIEQTQSAWLRIIERPSMPVAVNAVLMNETVPAKIRVSWKQGFDGNSPILHHFIQTRTLGPTNQWGVWENVVNSVPPENCCSWLIDNIKPSITAEFRVVAVNRHGSGIPSVSTNNITMPQQPPASAPTGVVASARSSTSVVVQWQPPPSEQWNGDILGYIIRYRLAGYDTLPWNEKNITNTLSRVMPIEPLITWRTYEIQIAAYNHRGLGVFSNSIEVTTLEGVPTQSPKKVEAKSINSTSISLSFIAPDQQRIPGVNLGYKVQFWKGAPGRGVLYKQEDLYPSGSEISVIVDGLEKWGHYNVTVLCYTSPGDGPRSDAVVVVTEEDIPGLVGDLGIDHDEIMSNSAVIQWNQPREANGKIINYEMNYWRNDDSEDKKTLELSGEQHEILLESLQPSTQYVVEIRAKTSKGFGPWSETRFESGVPPELPGRPSSLSISSISTRSVLLQFLPGFDGHTAIRQWIVEGRIGDSSIYHTLFNISSPKARSLNVTDLRPYTRYQLRLIAENVVGKSLPSEPTTAFETKATIPESPSSRLWFEPISATALVLTWTPLQHWQWNGHPSGYLITYRQNNTQDWKEIRISSLRATDFTLRDLRPFTVYEVDFFAENNIGKSAPTGKTFAKTYESIPSGAPTDIKATLEKNAQSTILIEWNQVEEQMRNGEIMGYKVRISPAEKPELRAEYEKTIEVDGEKTTKFKINDLRAFTSYNVFVSAHTVIGDGPENSIPATIMTGVDLPTEPENVGFSFVSEGEARLRWLPPANPNGRITKYIVTYVRVDDLKESEIDRSITVPIESTSFGFSANGLDANSRYRFTIKAENPMGFGPEAEVEVKTTSIQLPLKNPSPPKSDDQRPFSSKEIYVTWPEITFSNEDAPIRFVQVEYQKANDDEWTHYSDSITAKQNRITIKRLLPNTPYRVRIRFRGDFAQSTWSAESEWIKTLGDCPSAGPSQITTAPFENDGILLQWTTPERVDWNSDVLGYRISYRVYPSNESWQSSEIAPRHDHEARGQTIIRGLRRFQHYIVTMRSLNGQGVSDPTTPVFVYIGFSIPRGNVTGLTAEPSSSTSIKLNWNKWEDKDDVITGFKIRYVPLISVLSRQSTEEQLLIVENNTALLTDLMKYTQYQISVSPYNRAGEGGMAVVRETTLQDVPGPVGSLIFEDILLDSVNVSWSVPDRPNGRIVRYIVNYYTSKLKDEFLKNIKQPTQMPFIVVTGLEEGATYFFSVHAETSAGAGAEMSGNVTIGSAPDGPVAPMRPRAISGHTSITLQWVDGTVTADGVLGHLIQAKRVANAETTKKTISPEKRIRRASYDVPTHRMGEWVTLSTTIGTATSFEISYHDLVASSYYVFRIFARNRRGIGKASPESDQLFVPASLPEDPFYAKLWFIAIVGMATLIVIILVVAFLCITGSARKEKKRHHSIDSLQLADGNLATFHLKQSNDRISRSRNEPLTRPGTNTSWISDREPPTYGSVLGGGGNGVPNMYGHLATDIMPRANDLANTQRLSILAGRDVRGSVYAKGVNAQTARADLLSPRSIHQEQQENSDGFDSFDEEGDGSERSVDAGNDIAGHYNHSDHYSATWRRVRAREAQMNEQPARIGIPPQQPYDRQSSSILPTRPESSDGAASDTSWPSHHAPAPGISSFV